MTARDNDRILSALASIPAAEQSYSDWLRAGMALHHEGFDVSVWDAWSQNDSRYHGEKCERKWKSFRESENPVTAGYIIYLAKQYGWSNKPKEIAWEDVIFVGDNANTMPVPQADKLTPAQQLLTYIKTIFSEDEYVSYTTESYLDEDDKYRPKNGSYDRTAGQLIHQLEQCSGDISAVFGDWDPAGGAWIRFNPVDGQGAADSYVT